MLIKNCPPVAAYYSALLDALSGLSVQLHAPPPSQDSFIDRAHDVLTSFCDDHYAASQNGSGGDTFLYPMIQAGQLGIRQHEDALDDVFAHISSCPQARLTFTSGYWNPTQRVVDNIARCNLPTTTIVASPSANSFYTAKGISRHVPHLYTMSQLQFLRQTAAHPIVMREYTRDGWTYHAKGFWLHDHNQRVKLTAIGSSNYGMRSMNMDVEAEALLTTENAQLQLALQKEAEHIQSFTTEVDEQALNARLEVVPRWVKTVQPLLINFT
jgi:CDP-diacylglycerol--glycerol-3-phosphate 3-phosphatidyltransferase